MLIVNLLQLDLEKRFKLSNLIRKTIQNLKEYIPGEQPSDKNLIKLNTNENPYLPSPMFRTFYRWLKFQI